MKPVERSPPPRAEWVEIYTGASRRTMQPGLRPHGRSGLKSVRHNRGINPVYSLRPHGRSGLKLVSLSEYITEVCWSPPPRAEWVEISFFTRSASAVARVSAPTGGVG